MSPLIRRVARVLRSRRLAVGLVLSIVVYMMGATAFPQGSPDGKEVLAWGRHYPLMAPVARVLGLHHAYTTPVFIIGIALLIASTAACAWERTRGALRAGASRGRVPESLARRLRDRPQFTIELPEGAEPDASLARAADHLAPLGLRTRTGPRLLEAGGGWGWGSPVFHWSLVLLMAVIALGQLTRAQGMVGLRLGVPVVDDAPAYALRRAGPLYGGHSGLRMVASDLDLDHMAGGTRRGPAPVVSLVRPDGTIAARQRVYPNNPLRHGALMIHMNDYGLSPLFSVEGTSGAVEASTAPLVDFGSRDRYGSTPVLFTLSAQNAEPVEVTARVPVDRRDGFVVEEVPKDPRVDVVVSQGASAEETVTLRPGETLELPSGNRLRLEDIRYYVRLSVADDWSVYPIYALFAFAGVALSLSLFSPPRTVWILFVETPQGPCLHIVCRHVRRAPVFVEAVEEALGGLSP